MTNNTLITRLHRYIASTWYDKVDARVDLHHTQWVKKGR